MIKRRQRQNVWGLAELRQDAAGRALMNPDEMNLKLRHWRCIALHCIALQQEAIHGRVMGEGM